jgi:hypothetical protein
MLCFLGLKTTKEYFTCGSCSGSSCSFTPPSVLKNNSMNDKNSGNLDPIDDSSCLKMGLCTQYKTISDLKKYNLPYLTPSGIKFVSAPINTNIDNICPNGYITDGVNLHQGCANQSNGLYICKYFTNLN